MKTQGTGVPDYSIRVRPTQAATDQPLAVAAMLVVGVAGGYSTVILPLIISAVSQRLHLNPSSAETFASAEMAGVGIGTFIAGLRMHVANRRSLAAFGAIVAIIGNLAAVVAISFKTLLVARLGAGLGAGVMLATMAGGLGATTHAERNFAYSMGLAFLLATVSFRCLPDAATAGGVTAVFASIAAASGAALLAALRFPQYSPTSKSETGRTFAMAPDSRPNLGKAALVALTGNLAFYSGIGGVWPLMERIGMSLGLKHTAVASILAQASIAAFIGATIAAGLGTKVGRRLPLTSGLLIVAVSLAWLGVAQFTIVFRVVPLIFLAAWWFTGAYLMGAVAAIDPSGRAVALNVTLQFAGLTVGPLVADVVTRLAGLSGAIWMGTAGALISLALFSTALRISSVR